MIEDKECSRSVGVLDKGKNQIWYDNLSRKDDNGIIRQIKTENAKRNHNTTTSLKKEISVELKKKNKKVKECRKHLVNT